MLGPGEHHSHHCCQRPYSNSILSTLHGSLLALYGNPSLIVFWYAVTRSLPLNLFLEKMVEEMRFPIESIQTNRGREFFAYKVQEWLGEYCIKFRPIRPGQPHLNGKVERAQQTDLKEFWALADLSKDHLSDRLSEYQDYYNWDRLHGSLGKTPMDRVVELSQETPFWYQVEDSYDPSKKFIRVQTMPRILDY